MFEVDQEENVKRDLAVELGTLRDISTKFYM